METSSPQGGSLGCQSELGGYYLPKKHITVELIDKGSGNAGSGATNPPTPVPGQAAPRKAN
jgi:hypothetical protein